MREALLALGVLCLVVLVGMTPRGALFFPPCIVLFMSGAELGARWRRGILSWPTYVSTALVVGHLVLDPFHIRVAGAIAMLAPLCGWAFGIARRPVRRSATAGGGG